MRASIGTYENPDAVGYLGWIRTEGAIIFVCLDGSLTPPFVIPAD